MKNLALAAGILAIAALTWVRFPGHTWLQQDTQIYVPILEHLRDPAVLRRDMLVERPHVSFTLYDETARSLARVTGLGFREVLEGEQIVTRALGIWGLYLMAAALGLSAPASLLGAGSSLWARPLPARPCSRSRSSRTPAASPCRCCFWRSDRSEEHTSELQSLTNLVCR